MSFIGDIGGSKKKFNAKDHQATHVVPISTSDVKYPYETLHLIILGPDTFASKDGDWIWWRGVDYARVEKVKPVDPVEQANGSD
jgi:hypothetical protein